MLIDEKLKDRRLFLEKVGFSEKGILEEELDNDLLNHFRNRKSLLISLEEVSRTWKITNEGMKISSEDLEEKIMIAEITPELLQEVHGKMRNLNPMTLALNHQLHLQENHIPCSP